ncbi:Pyridine nucleotide-disulfide oxidoreductase, FAD/NAD(P)-binding domain protein [Moelleriella libera RCEF 2490]|uniref:Pyridine nucleotide-disulfide oxidoreductase, FAD/NAD(P)-binding domain protein n=1 Tax=Moelleriella libera RCEF 2490 TaxID=1081109 RepID=A0A167XDY2_9HYPO|nr:Pyridine nucleotide-disulfide oxidoreductase, FAD/NAD(P)-binding domain protein [Moelleriella libera RCEF 2490]
MKTIVVLGVGLAGAPLIRQIMRTIVLKKKGYKMIVVSPTTHFLWPIAMPRVVVPGELVDDKVLFPLDATFKEYPTEKFEFVLGHASSLDPAKRSVSIAISEGASRHVQYDTLIVATGSSAKDEMPWKLIGDAERTIERLHQLQKKVEVAKTIVVAGGGLTGAETAGELGYKYAKHGQKEVYFVYNHELPLSPAVIDSVRKQTQTELQKMKVKLVPSTSIVGVKTQGDDTVLELRGKDGSSTTLKTQAYLPTTGVTPNTAFAPQEMLDGKGYIKQTRSLRAEGYDDIFVIGDAGNLEDNRALAADAQAGHLIKALPAYFENGELAEYKVSTKPMYAITLGQSKATGQMGNMKLFGFLVWFLKGRFLGTDKAPLIAAGKMTLSATFEK